MLIKVFVLGRPGSGKSTAVRHFVTLARRRNYPVFCMKDYDILYRMFQEDRSYKQFHPADYGGFDVLDKTVFDTALKQLEKDILAIPHSENVQLMTIEFARDDYRTALKLFSPEFLCDSFILFVDADLQSCIRRIHQRVEEPSEPDHHFVSDYIMQTYYNKDSWMYVSSLLKEEYPFFENVVSLKNTGSLPYLLDRVGDFAEMVFQIELSRYERKKAMKINSGNHANQALLGAHLDQSSDLIDVKYSTTSVPSSSTSYKQYTDELRSGPFVLAP